METINTDDFMLQSETAKVLYNVYAKDLPIVDYHSHVIPQEIFEDKRYDNITELWLGGDHYKWRLMRAAGVTEDLITGVQSFRRSRWPQHRKSDIPLVSP